MDCPASRSVAWLSWRNAWQALRAGGGLAGRISRTVNEVARLGRGGSRTLPGSVWGCGERTLSDGKRGRCANELRWTRFLPGDRVSSGSSPGMRRLLKSEPASTAPAASRAEALGCSAVPANAAPYESGSQLSAWGNAAFQKSQSWPPDSSRSVTSMPVPRKRSASTRLACANGSLDPHDKKTRGRGRSQ